MGDELEYIEDVTAERVLVCDIITVVIMIVFVDLCMDGRQDNLTLEGEIRKGREIIYQISGILRKMDICLDMGACY